ncbi:MAG: ABC transporter permease [Leucobacter sp.]
MRIVLGISGRNLRLFFRDPMNVFFSLLGALIVFGLYTLFLGNLQVLSITASAPGADEDTVKSFVDAWMFAAIVTLTTITTPLGALSVFVEDSSTGRFRDFLVSPIRRGQLVLGYVGSAFAVGIIMSVIVFVVSLLYLGMLSNVVLSVTQIALCLVWIVLSTAAFTALWSFVVPFVSTPGAFAGLSTIVGTIAGFIAGAYIAVGLFPDAVRDVVSALPFAQAAMLMRHEFAADPLAELVGDNPQAVAELGEFYGMTLAVGDWAVPTWFVIALLVVITGVFTALAAVRIRSRIR